MLQKADSVNDTRARDGPSNVKSSSVQLAHCADEYMPANGTSDALSRDRHGGNGICSPTEPLPDHQTVAAQASDISDEGCLHLSVCDDLAACDGTSYTQAVQSVESLVQAICAGAAALLSECPSKALQGVQDAPVSSQAKQSRLLVSNAGNSDCRPHLPACSQAVCAELGNETTHDPSQHPVVAQITSGGVQALLWHLQSLVVQVRADSCRSRAGEQRRIALCALGGIMSEVHAVAVHAGHKCMTCKWPACPCFTSRNLDITTAVSHPSRRGPANITCVLQLVVQVRSCQRAQ